MDLPTGLTYASLCAGYGGIDLALKLAAPESRCLLYVENEVTATEILVSRMREGWLDDAPVWSDLRTFDGKPWRGVLDLIVAGIPCQPVSCAGKQLGKHDERWLWEEALRVIDEVEPSLVFFENPPGLVHHGLDDILRSLSRMGYGIEAGLFSAEEVGASHERERVFILGYAEKFRSGSWRTERQGFERISTSSESGNELDDTESFDGGLHERSGNEDRTAVVGGRSIAVGHAEESRHEWSGRARRWRNGSENDGGELGNAISTGLERRTELGCDEREECETAERTRLPLFAPARNNYEQWAEILAVRPDLHPTADEETVASFRGVSDGPADWLARSDRIRAIGNGVVPLCAAKAFRTLWKRMRTAQ